MDGAAKPRLTSGGEAVVTRRYFVENAIGVLIGIAGAVAVTRLMHSLLFNTSATDPMVFIMISVLLAVAAFLACYIPARRAAKVDPSYRVALRVGILFVPFVA